jgi:hypothetical protein
VAVDTLVVRIHDHICHDRRFVLVGVWLGSLPLRHLIDGYGSTELEPEPRLESRLVACPARCGRTLEPVNLASPGPP